MLTVVIPARNEEGTIYALCQSARQYVEEVIVVDDGSDDATSQAASEAGAKIVSNR
ncbi:glycosyltransferase, partial [Chloroflexota bacterium]